ncbi:MAG: CoA-binding protein [Helicobacteraceae bacterium]|jgi:predicted CoA-binding protein|nr:CoA-binding protein [Helicobacteraceae bacterium]
MELDYRTIFDKVKTIAIAGLSPDATKPSHYVSKYLLERGYDIIPIYPKGETVLGAKIYDSLTKIPDRVDMVVVFRKSAYVGDLIDEVIKRGDVKIVWLQPDIINDEACAKAERHGVAVSQNVCAMQIHREIYR